MNLVESISWSNNAETRNTAGKLQLKHLTFIATNLRDRLSDYSDLIEDLQDCEAEVLYRILSSPQVCSLIYNSSPKIIYKAIKKFIAYERYIRGNGSYVQPNGWSCHADIHYSGSAITKAPKIHGITIDFEHPFESDVPINSNFRPAFGESQKFDATQEVSILNKIDRAIISIEKSNPSILFFTTQLIKSITPRMDKKNLSFKGSSNRAYIGRVNLFNLHFESVDYGVIANSLIHEAIHTSLYIIEQDSECIDSEKIAHNTRIKSPWSGNMTNTLAFLHAAFVWYSLYMFWSNQEYSKHFNANIVDYYLRFCGNGFKEDRVIESLKPYAMNIRPDLFSQIELMQEKVNQLQC